MSEPDDDSRVPLLARRQEELAVTRGRFVPGRLRRLASRAARVREAQAGARPVADDPPPAGRAPDVAVERTNLGPTFDQQVHAARTRMPLGVDDDHDLLAEHFDVLHYLLASPRLMERPPQDLRTHFLRHGVRAGLSPDPDFSMTEYLERYPDRASGPDASPYLAWLREGRARGEIAEPTPGIERLAPVLGLEPQRVLDLVVDRRRDLQRRLRTGRLGQMVARAVEIEPLIGQAWQEITRPKLIPLTTRPVVDEISAIHAAHAAAGFRPARLLLVINRARWGAGRRMEGHVAHALASTIAPEEIVVLYTDDSATGPPDRFPDGVREIDVAELVRGMPEPDRQHALVTLIRTFGADAVVNINSRLLYQAMRAYGPALAATERIFPVFFCNEQGPMGTWRGWSLRYFYRTFEQVEGVITDSHHLAEELVSTYRVTPGGRERIHVFSVPVDPGLPLVPAPPSAGRRRPQVFWAGRWDRQKRIGLVAEVARRMPDVDIRMWGAPVLGGGETRLPDNVRVEGVYGHLTEIPLAEADAWLYTSGWDGVPSQLLEVAMTGIPIVGTLVGGTGEIITESEAWPVPADGGADAYEAAIRAVFVDPGEARRRAESLRARLLRDRTAEAFADTVSRVLLTGGGGRR